MPSPMSQSSTKLPCTDVRSSLVSHDDLLDIACHAMGGGIDKYPAKSHARRVAEQLGLSEGLIAIAGRASQLWPDSDMNAPFRQDRYFFYLTGCDEPDCYVTYDISRDKLTLWLPPISARKAVWGGQGSTVGEAMKKYDIDAARYVTVEARSILDDVSHLEVKDRDNTKFAYTNLRLSLVFGGAVGSVLAQSDLKPAINSCRVVKDEHEISLVRKANDISALAHTEVLKQLHKLKNEAEVEAIFIATSIAHQAKEQAYHPIAGSGRNAALLHYMTNREDFGSRETLLLDAGAEWSCYASDVTRTMPINPKNPGHWVSEEAKQIYELVESVQNDCIKMLRPGESFFKIHQAAQYRTLVGLRKYGILKGDIDEIWKAGTIWAFFPHGLGHHIGLECHDVSDEPRASRPDSSNANSITALDHHLSLCRSPCTLSAPTLKPGNIVTIEPGLYMNQELLKTYIDDEKHARFVDEEVLKKYIRVGGVRIEDCILITKDGHQNLTTAPKGEAALKIIRDAAAAANCR